MAKPKFKFEPGSYGDIGNFMPSIACLKGSMESGWKYHFVLVKSDINYQKEQEAILHATKDLDYAFEQKQMGGSYYAVTDSLKLKCYISVENFNIVK